MPFFSSLRKKMGLRVSIIFKEFPRDAPHAMENVCALVLGCK